MINDEKTKVEELANVRISDGVFSDENQICLPCQTMGCK